MYNDVTVTKQLTAWGPLKSKVHATTPYKQGTLSLLCKQRLYTGCTDTCPVVLMQQKSHGVKFIHSLANKYSPMAKSSPQPHIRG